MGTGAPDYFKRILLYGLHDSVATPLAVDGQGRPIFIVSPLSPFLGLGTILLTDDFTAGLTRAQTYATGAGAAVAIADTEAMSGGLSCKLTGGSDGDRYARIAYYCAPSTYTKLGLEFKLRLGTNIETLRVQMDVNDGVNNYRGRLRYNRNGIQWEVYDYVASEWVAVLENMLYLEFEKFFNWFKLVVDVTNGTYHKFAYPGGQADLTAYALGEFYEIQYRYAWVELRVTSAIGENGFVYLDDIIITQDES